MMRFAFHNQFIPEQISSKDSSRTWRQFCPECGNKLRAVAIESRRSVDTGEPMFVISLTCPRARRPLLFSWLTALNPLNPIHKETLFHPYDRLDVENITPPGYSYPIVLPTFWSENEVNALPKEQPVDGELY
jgi:hypothetical protein